MERRKFILQTALTSASILFSKHILAYENLYPVVRIPKANRKFVSKSVDKTISTLKKNIKNEKIAWLFENCFPNTLDTTVTYEKVNGKSLTYVITGDIDAMWLRDSAAQVMPYISLVNDDFDLKELIKGVINMQTNCILRDPYANAFFKDESVKGGWVNDKTIMKPGIHERKWEIDSLCYPIRLAYHYWKQTGDENIFDKTWMQAMQLVLQTFKEQQRLENPGPYSFQRDTTSATDTLPLNGYGYPTKKIGLIHSMFRPSDDATVFSFLIPSNIFAAEVLDNLSEMSLKIFKDETFADETKNLSTSLFKIINDYAIVNHPKYGKIYAYEINGFGSYNLMDDANVPNLLSIPYLTNKLDKRIVQNTRNFVLSTDNPFYFEGSVAQGTGGPHVGLDMIWHLGIIMRGITSQNEKEIREVLKMLQESTAGTGFMHESFHKNDVKNYTRSWFAWANTLFGEFILKLYKEHPELLN